MADECETLKSFARRTLTSLQHNIVETYGWEKRQRCEAEHESVMSIEYRNSAEDVIGVGVQRVEGPKEQFEKEYEYRLEHDVNAWIDDLTKVESRLAQCIGGQKAKNIIHDANRSVVEFQDGEIKESLDWIDIARENI